jgi:radical SAM superfamily enzyme YgiQ (UPF0313 family)
VKILLVRPRPAPQTIGLQHVMICEPLELEYLSSAIADLGHETVIVDMILETASVEDILREQQPDLVGVTGYISHVGVVREHCRAVRRVIPHCRTVVGGVHAEVVPGDFVDPAVDFIVNANPLTSFRQLVEALAAGTPTESIPGLWRSGAPPCPRETTFAHPWPDRAKVARYRSRYYYLFHNPCALMKTSFGCPHDCAFCFCREVTGGTYFRRELDDVLAELASLPEEDVYLVDDDFLVSRERVLAFCRGVRAAGLRKRFLIYGRADFIAKNEDVIAEFKSAGLRAVIVGLESCRAEELARMNKRTDVATNEDAVRVLARQGVDCYATLILGLDWTAADFDRLGDWLRGLGLIFVNLQPFTPLPGTGLHEAYRDRLSVPREAYEQWDLAHLVVAPTRMPPAEYYRRILKLYRQVTLRPSVLWMLARRYGVWPNLRLLAGAMRVARQYRRRARAGDRE